MACELPHLVLHRLLNEETGPMPRRCEPLDLSLEDTDTNKFRTMNVTPPVYIQVLSLANWLAQVKISLNY